MTHQTHRAAVGAKLAQYHTGQWSHLYSVASRLLADQIVSRKDLDLAADQLDATGLRGSKSLAKILRTQLAPFPMPAANLLRDSLHTLTDTHKSDDYKRGLIVASVSALMAAGWSFDKAWLQVRASMPGTPENYKHLIPETWPTVLR